MHTSFVLLFWVHVLSNLVINLFRLLTVVVCWFWFSNPSIYLLLVKAWKIMESKFCKRLHQLPYLAVCLLCMKQFRFSDDWNKLSFCCLLILSAKWIQVTDSLICKSLIFILAFVLLLNNLLFLNSIKVCSLVEKWNVLLLFKIKKICWIIMIIITTLMKIIGSSRSCFRLRTNLFWRQTDWHCKISWIDNLLYWVSET